MDLADRKVLRPLLERHGIVLAKTYGQHFLVDRKALDRILEAAFPEKRRDQDLLATGYSPTGLVVEVGPGAGTLTIELAKRCETVIAIERDQRFIPVLKVTLADFDNVSIVQADAMKTGFSDLLTTHHSPLTSRYSIVSNLPYEISTPFLWKALHDEPVRPSEIIVLLQDEVVDRALEKRPKMNILSLLVALSGKADKPTQVGKASFFPPPRVESAVLRIRDIKPELGAAERRALALAKRAFVAPRKKLSNTIGDQAGAFGDKRPAELGAEEWLTLVSQ